MLIIKYFFLAGFVAIAGLSYAQSNDEELLEWNAYRKLTWEDYQAAPDLNSDAAASTTTYLGIEYKLSYNNFGYKIKSRFSKTKSWGLYKTPYILAHEQGHFDIAEIFARKLNKEVSEYKFNKNTAQQKLDETYQRILDEKEKMQNDYDYETRHSINKEKQDVWLKKIAVMLEAYKEYADY